MRGARTPPSRVSQARILADLKLAAKKGDRSALSLALDRMRTLAHSPRYWEKYLGLLRNPVVTPGYWSPECRNGGKLDLRPHDPNWPN